MCSRQTKCVVRHKGDNMETLNIVLGVLVAFGTILVILQFRYENGFSKYSPKRRKH